MRLRTTHKNNYLLLAVGLLSLPLLAAPLLWRELTAEFAIYFGLLTLFTVSVGGVIFYCWLQGQLDWFEPGVFVALLYLLVMGYGGLRLLAQPQLLHPVLQGDRRWVPLALFFVLLGILAFWAGYYTGLGHKLHQLFRRPQRERLWAAAAVRPVGVVIIYGVGLLARLYMVRMGWYAYLQERASYFSSLASAQLFGLLELFCWYAVVLAWLDHFGHPREPNRRLLAWVLLGSELFWGFFSGMKGRVIHPLLLLIMVYAYKKGRFPVRALALTLLLIIPLYPLNNAYRELVGSGELHIKSPLDMVTSSPVIMRKVLFQFNDPNLYLESGYQSTVSRTTTSIQNYALLLRYLDRTGAYWYAKEWILLPALVFVPRFVWPSKPLADKGYWFATQVWGQDPRVYSSVTPTFPGDLHLQFGLLSLLLGMFLFGVLLRFVYERYARPRSDYSLFFYVFLLYNLVQHEAGVAFKLAGTVKIFLILLALSFLVFRFPRRTVLVQPAAAPPPLAGPVASS